MKIKFKNLGNVREGEIELRPLTVFIGPNNTGKTYCAYNIYGIFDEGIINIMKEDFEINSLDESINNLKEKGYVKINIKEILREYSEKILNKSCDVFSKKLLYKFMQTKKKDLFYDTRLEINMSKNDIEYIVSKVNNIKLESKIGKGENETILNITKDKNEKEMIICLNAKDKEDEKFINELFEIGIINKIILDVIIENMYKSIRSNIFVLPAERTTLVSVYKYLGKKGNKLADKIFDTILEDVEEKHFKELIESLMISSYYKYPKPIKDFIKFLENLDELSKRFEEDNEWRSDRKEFIELAERIEEEILGGKIKLVKYEEIATPTLEFEYKEGKSIEMHLTSSMVKELTGLVLYFKYLAVDNGLLIIDEPEMNLHPEAQVKLLEILTMAVNRGLKIIITTHSPYITDQLTNLMECYIVKDKIKDKNLKKYIFTGQKEAIISSEKVGVYFFGEDGIIKDILNREDTLIDWETFSKVSERLGVIYDDLLDLEFEDKERGEEYADE